MAKSAAQYNEKGALKINCRRSKCGEIFYFRDERKISYQCSRCDTEWHRIEAFLRHTLYQHFDVSEEECEQLLRREKSQEEEYVQITPTIDDASKEVQNITMDEKDKFITNLECLLDNSIKVEVLDNSHVEDEELEERTETLVQDYENLLEANRIGVTEKCFSADNESKELLASNKCLEDSRKGNESKKEVIHGESGDTLVNFEVVLVDSLKQKRTKETAVKPKPKLIERKNEPIRRLPSWLLPKPIADAPLFVCKTCGKVFKKRHRLNLHEGTHASKDEKPFACEFCDARFVENGNLTVHRNRHLGIKPHSCKECNKAFTTSTELTMHIRMHTKERPYMCAECGRSFSTSSHLSAHKRRHMNYRPNVCATCGKGFYSKALLTEHATSHSSARPHVCNTCGAGFARNVSLRQHLKLHSDVKRYVCQICSKAFAQNAGLHSHMKSHGIDKSKNK